MKDISYALFEDVSLTRDNLCGLVDLPTFFDICHYAYRKDEGLFRNMSGGYSGFFLTSTLIEVGNESVRIRTDTHLESVDGWSAPISYPWESIRYASFARKNREKFEQNPLFRAIFNGRTQGLYAFGHAYAPHWFDFLFEGLPNDEGIRYVIGTVDMAHAEGKEFPGVITIDFSQMPLQKNYEGIFKVNL